jgi:putative DNA-invertase from lambdoid prophage Rac
MTHAAIAYLRVSTDEQTVQNQKLALERWAESNDFHILDFFADEAVSGRVPAVQRPSFQKMLQFVGENLVDAVLVYELSRMGRSMFESLDAIKLVEKSAPIISCGPRESFLQTTEPSIRRLLLGILTWVAERERELLVERTKAGMERAKAAGKRVGRPSIDWTPEILRYVSDSLLDGRAVDRIARDLKISKATLYEQLHGNELCFLLVPQIQQGTHQGQS